MKSVNLEPKNRLISFKYITYHLIELTINLMKLITKEGKKLSIATK